MCAQVRSQMRAEGLKLQRHPRPAAQAPARDPAAQIIDVYARLAASGRHLLAGVIGDSAPQAWAHYPADDARDAASGYQWFYHSHSADDRPGSEEHGHIHLFARQAAWRGKVYFAAERRWRERLGVPGLRARTRHLLCIGFNAKGVPSNLFTVNRWVTGDMLFSAEATLRLLSAIRLETGNAEVDRLTLALVCLCRPEKGRIMQTRDAVLLDRARRGPGVFDDSALEVLSEVRIDLDRILERRSGSAGDGRMRRLKEDSRMHAASDSRYDGAIGATANETHGD